MWEASPNKLKVQMQFRLKECQNFISIKSSKYFKQRMPNSVIFLFSEMPKIYIQSRICNIDNNGKNSEEQIQIVLTFIVGMGGFFLRVYLYNGLNSQFSLIIDFKKKKRFSSFKPKHCP